MDPNRKILRAIPVIVLLVGSSALMKAQFYEVYGYTTPGANEKELVYWTTYIPSSDHSYSFFGDTVEKQGMFSHSFELEYGVTNNLTVSIYADFEQPRGQNIKWIRTKAVMFYYQILEKNRLPVDLALYGEYKLPRKGYDNAEEIEFKLIMEKDIKYHRIILNPTIEKKISGEDVTEGVEFGLSGAYTFVKNPNFQPRIEYYSKMGELYDMPAYAEQKNYIFPSFDLWFGKFNQFRWHAGVGFGLTNPADNIVVKSILAWGFF